MSNPKDCQPPRYSVAEIDRMRTALSRLLSLSFYKKVVTDTTCEDELRTHMLNGTTAGELEAEIPAAEQALREFHERREAEREEGQRASRQRTREDFVDNLILAKRNEGCGRGVRIEYGHCETKKKEKGFWK